MVETSTFNNVEKEEVQDFIRVILGLGRNETVPWETKGWDMASIRGKEMGMLEIRIDGVVIKYRLVMCPSPLPLPQRHIPTVPPKGKKAIISIDAREDGFSGSGEKCL